MVRHDIVPKLIVDLESSRDAVLQLVSSNHWSETKLFFIKPTTSYIAFSDDEGLQLERLITELDIQKSIISTPPEVHILYAKLCLKKKVKILIDKPL